MSEKPKTAFMEPYQRRAVVNEGVLESLWWTHSAGDEEIDMTSVLSVWETVPEWKGKK